MNSNRKAIIMAAMACGIGGSANAAPLPDTAMDEHLQTASASVVVAGGCFWGIQAVFQHIKGVTSAVSGYAGGEQKTAEYEVVSSGTTGHAESVQVTYDPKQVTLGQLLKVFFSVAHNPTELNYQGPDHGTQYRSAIFYSSAEQKKIAEAYIDQIGKAKSYNEPIVTTLEPLKAFYPAEGYHQNYATLNPNNPYIVHNDLPKVANLQKEFPALYTP